MQGDIRRVSEAINNSFAGPDLKAEWDALQAGKTVRGGRRVQAEADGQGFRLN